jgi:HEAT repeats
MTHKMLFATIVALLISARPATAQNADVPALIKLVENQPTDMPDKSAWKEKRREAARKLAQSKDKRAVPTLIRLAETETFDIIGEIAIEGLGNLGDKSAVPVLQKIANDAAREKPQRELAKKALGKLGASTKLPPGPTVTEPTGTGTTGTGTTGTGTTGTGTTGTGTTGTGTTGTGTTGTGNVGTGTTADPNPLGTGKLGGDKRGGNLLGKQAEGLPVPPEFPDDTIAAWDRLTFALGSAALGYDTVRRRTSFDVDASSIWAHRVERERMAFGWDAGAHVVAGYINPTGGAAGRAQARGTQIDLTGGGEARFYSGKVYGIGRAALGSQIFNIAVKGQNAMQDVNDTRMTADLQIALGAGYGRLLDVGGAIRVRRLSRTLDAAKALGKPIDPAVAKKLQLTWWALRAERSSYRALVATVAILREAGVLLVEPDAGLSFEILNVLRDSQLFMRPSGLDIQVAFGEGYLRRPDDNMGNFPFSGEQGRVEQLLASAGYGAQLADDTVEVSGTAYARYRLFAPTGMNLDQPSPWAFGATARFRRFTYGEHGDPFGALDVSATLQVSDDNPIQQINMGQSDLGVRLSGQVGFTWWLNQASGFRLAATAAADGGEFFFGVQLSAAYGVLDATFSH